MTDLRDALSHVLWIGGGPQAGKTTLSRLLAGKYDLKLHNLDWHGARGHRLRPGEAAASFEQLSMDERWVQPIPHELFERSVIIWTERFDLVVEDLLALPTDRPILAEGPGAFPWCVAPLLASPRQALFLVPTLELRERVAQRRWGAAGARFDGYISDPDRAWSNIRARDTLLDARIESSCRELGLRCERMDGSSDLDASLELLEEQFGPHLPTTYNV